MPKERLDKLLSNLGYCTRSELRKALDRVEINGEPARKVDQKVEWFEVTWEGEPVDPDPLWILLHKPEGVTCSHKDVGRLVFEMFPERYLMRKPALSTVGRLDRDTTGVLLLTTDGAALHRLTSPRSQVDKVYRVDLVDAPSSEQLERLRQGGGLLDEDDKPLLPCAIEVTGERQVEMTLHEGRYHQVKRMWVSVGNQVEKLHRVRFHRFGVGELAAGEYRLLSPEESLDL
ncbi:rRNA pseudouridine synthase [bacterium]|nr:rRNA pseudouridine synthase [bacterium]